METIFEEANSSTSEPLAVSAKAQPSSFTSQPSNTESDIIPTMSAKPMSNKSMHLCTYSLVYTSSNMWYSGTCL